MPYTIPEKELVVFFSPKSGGTSVRAFLFHLENGFPFSEYRIQGKLHDANALLTNNRFRIADHNQYKDFRRFAVVRDPVRRFLSGYGNRVVHYGELSAAHLGDRLSSSALPPDPDIDTFVDKFTEYRALSKSIDRHFSPQQKFIGGDPSYYEKIFRLEEISNFVHFINTEYKGDAVMPRLQSGGPKIDFDVLSDKTQAKILSLCQNDVAFKIFPDYAAKYTGAPNA